MNLSKKTFIYSFILSGGIVTLIIIYFVVMLPSLYIDHLSKSHYQSIKKIQENYIKDKNYNNIYSPNPSGTVSVRIPSDGNSIYASNSFGTSRITIKDIDLVNLLDDVRYYTKNIDEAKEVENYESNNKNPFNESSYKMNVVSDDTIIYEFNSFDGINYYTFYSAITISNEDIILSLLSVMTPKIEEITSIVFQSLPMIVSVLILIILVSTYYFSRKIIIPIKKLANHAEFMKNNNISNVYPIEIKGEDEISVLGNTLNELYIKLNESFKSLEEKNKLLIAENKRQDVFLRASSHQLKTPVAASLLLIESMIDEVGKYKNTKEHLPKVKVQLQAIRKIIDEILNLNNKDLNKKMIDIKDLIDEIINQHEIQIKEKFINVESKINNITLDTDYHLMYKIIDNLITNAINYTSEKNDIKIILSDDSLKIINYGSHIDEELLPNIFDAFVSSNSESRGNGLGLYIAYYYSNLLGYKIEINNISNGVEAILSFI